MTVLIAEKPFINGAEREFTVHPDQVRAHLMIIASASLSDFDSSFGDEPVDDDGDGTPEWSRVIYAPEGVDPATDAGAVKAALKQLVDLASNVEIYGVDWTWILSSGGDTATATPGVQLGNTVIYDTSQANGQGRWMRDTNDDKKCVLDAEILYHELSHVRLNHGGGDAATEEREARIEEARLQRALGRPARSETNGEAGVGCEGEGPCCIVATVAGGGPYAPTVARLRLVRDHALRGTALGEAWFAELFREYYRFSVPLARAMVRDPAVRGTIGAGFVEPLVDALELAVMWAGGAGDDELGRAIAARAASGGGPELDTALPAFEPLAEWLPRSPHVGWALVDLLVVWMTIAAEARATTDDPAATGRRWREAMGDWIERMPLDAALAQTAATPAERHARVRELLDAGFPGADARAAADRLQRRAAP